MEGSSDDLDLPIREVFKDTEFVKRYNLSSINSINWARILVQIAHHFYAYYQVRIDTRLLLARSVSKDVACMCYKVCIHVPV